MGYSHYWHNRKAEEVKDLIPPWQVEQALNISPWERRKWQKDGRLKVEKFIEIYHAGQLINVPYFSPEVLNITQETIENWRKVDLEAKRQKMKAARTRAVEKAKKTITERKEILEKLEEQSQKLGVYSGTALKAAFWARLASRWAKRQQLKNAVKRTIQPEEMYEIKNSIIKKIWKLKEIIKEEGTEIELKFFVPEEPHRYNVVFCDEHYEQFADERKYLYDGDLKAIEFFFLHEEEIRKCKKCIVNITKHYYSLFSLKIKFKNGTNYHFHIPYPIGKEYFPSRSDLEQIDEIENEYGMFRFGTPVTEDEERLFPIKLVQKESKKIIDELQHLIQQAKQKVATTKNE
ncbi:hypothetical protein SAMN04244560_00855 [Thermoanaerobacter thermohydrosulfuricus]|uniref:Uncharacterized protein n=1 Tax=Thermoanaerobacter thermohydrosulfuricus TaxID=1516 RepID=A0A1G7LSU9_THETY|nr:hypothetical protein [Thermoanaerobacter thermohydrosulfuricus]SDF52039.1 hypothetical protein SAMN04244560_00855 [Thermoanaerobacter thermohydrosulfuricus]